MKEKINCFNCKKEMYVRKHEIKRSKTGRFFCSRSCSAKVRNTGRHRSEQEKVKIKNSLIKKYLEKKGISYEQYIAGDMKHQKRRKNHRFCNVCGKELYTRKKYCSIDCFNKSRNSRYKNKCKNCGKEYMSCIKSNFCNRNCVNIYKWKKRKERIELNGDFGDITNFAIVRKYIKEVRGHCCSICGIKEWLGDPVPLVLDHIDGDSGNNKLENLRVVCGNCDMRLPTYKSKNRGKGRRSIIRRKKLQLMRL